MDTSNDEDEIIKYLLGELDANAQEALDARFVAEPSLAETVMAIEDDLLFEYARGDLPAQTRARIEKAYNETPARRARLDAAYAFLHSILRSAGARSRQRQAVRRIYYFIVSVLAAAAVLLAVWLPSHKHSGSPSTGSDASFELVAGLTRSGAGRQIVLPPGAQTIEFQLQLQNQPDFRNWRVSLGTVEHPEGWSGPASLRDRRVVTAVPSSVLAPGDYSLRLFGGDAGTDMPLRASYYFRIE
jgi:anti-sigma-K factor RskA